MIKSSNDLQESLNNLKNSTSARNNEIIKSASLYDLIQLSIGSQTNKGSLSNGMDLTSFIRDAMRHAQPKTAIKIEKRRSSLNIQSLNKQERIADRDHSHLLMEDKNREIQFDKRSEQFIQTQPEFKVNEDNFHFIQFSNGTQTPVRSSSLSDISYKDSTSNINQQDNKQSGEVNEQSTPKDYLVEKTSKITNRKTSKIVCKHKKGHSSSKLSPKKTSLIAQVETSKKSRIQAFVTPIRIQDQLNTQNSARYSSISKEASLKEPMMQKHKNSILSQSPREEIKERNRSKSTKSRQLNKVSSVKEKPLQNQQQQKQVPLSPHRQLRTSVLSSQSASTLKKTQSNAHLIKKIIVEDNDSSDFKLLLTQNSLKDSDFQGSKSFKAALAITNKNNLKYEYQSPMSPQDSQSLKKVNNQALIKKLSKGPSKKKQMMVSLNNLNVGILDEFLRIKKPQKQALIIGQLFCVLICAFRQPPLDDAFSFEMVQGEFEKWESIQNFILTSPNRILNITNKNFKDIFDIVHRTLQYVDQKHFRLRQVKNMISQTQLTNFSSLLFSPMSSNNETQSNFQGYANKFEEDNESEDLLTPVSIQQDEIIDDSKILQISSQKPLFIKSLILDQEMNLQRTHLKEEVTSTRINSKFLNSVIQQAQQQENQLFPSQNQFTDRQSVIYQPDVLQYTIRSNLSDFEGSSCQSQVQSSQTKHSPIKQQVKTQQKKQKVYAQLRTSRSPSKLEVKNPIQKGINASKTLVSKSPIVFKKRQVANKNAQELSLTSQLIQFKNQTHKFKVESKNSNKSQSSLQKSSSQLLQNPKTISDGTSFNQDQHEQKDTEGFDNNNQFQILNYQKDIFSTDIKVTEDEFQSSSQDNIYEKVQELHQRSSIKVYSPNDSNNNESERDQFQFKLVKMLNFDRSENHYSQQKQEALGMCLTSMKSESTSNERYIDMSTIEDLKRRRAQSKERGCGGADLNEQRELIIKKIQEELLGHMQSKTECQ